MDDHHITELKLNDNFAQFQSRLLRAVEHREELSRFCQDESAINVRTLVRNKCVKICVSQAERVPSIASTVLSDWLHQVRSALDGAFYTLAALETGKYPPSHPRTRTFPICRSRADFERMLESSSNPMRNMKLSTINQIETSQPYNNKYGSDGDCLLWLHDMARIDRHRHTFDLALRIIPDDQNCVRFSPRSPDKWTLSPGPSDVLLEVDNEVVYATIEYERPESAAEVHRNSWIQPHFMFSLEASQWYKAAVSKNESRNIRNDGLTTRMYFCEWFVGAMVKMLSDQSGIEQLHIPRSIKVGD